MVVKSDRLEARISPEQRARLEWAASLAGVSLSTFVIDAAVERADEVVAGEMSTSVSATYFDELVSALDDAEKAPTLRNAARRAARRPRIAAR